MDFGKEQVGYDGAVSPLVTAAPPVVLQNIGEGSLLILENRYAGPLAVQPALAQSAQPHGPLLVVPPLSRCAFPWPSDHWAILQQRRTLFGNYLLHAANGVSAVLRWQTSSVRWMFLDSDAGVGVEQLYPYGSRLVVARQIHPITQGANAQMHVVGIDPAPAVAGNTVVRVLEAWGDTRAQPPVNPDTRFLRFRVTAEQGTAQLQDLEANIWYELTNGGASGQFASVRPFGSTAVVTTEHQSSDWIECPGAVAISWDADGGAAGVNVNITAMYEIGIPYD